MKRRFLAVLVLAAVAGYAYLPYRAVARFEEAIRSADKVALKELVDFPALRESVKAELKAKSLGVPGKEQNMAGAVGSMFAGALLDKMVDEMVTPDLLAATLKLQATAGGEPATFREKRWTGPTEMTARGDGATLVVFKLTGADGWKVIGIRDGAAK